MTRRVFKFGRRPINRSIVPVDPLAPFMALLGFDRQGGDGPGIETPQADWLARFLAKAIGSIVKPLHRRFDLRNQLALAVAGSEFERAIGFRRRCIWP